MFGKFDCNKTPLAPPVAKALISEAASRRAAWAPHAVNRWYLGPAMNHYRAFKFFIESTRGVRIPSNFKLMPSHCKVPSIFKEDETVLPAAILLSYVYSKFDQDEQLKHTTIIKQLTQIIANGPHQRVAVGTPQRVAAPSTSVDITAPETIRTSKRIHQRQTRSNTPMPSITEEIVDAEEGCASTYHHKEWRRIATSGGRIHRTI